MWWVVVISDGAEGGGGDTAGATTRVVGSVGGRRAQKGGRVKEGGGASRSGCGVIATPRLVFFLGAAFRAREKEGLFGGERGEAMRRRRSGPLPPAPHSK